MPEPDQSPRDPVELAAENARLRGIVTRLGQQVAQLTVANAELDVVIQEQAAQLVRTEQQSRP